MVLRMKNFNILGVHWRIQLLGGGGSQKTNIDGGLPKSGGGGVWTVCQFSEGGLGKKEWGCVFEKKGDTPMYTMIKPPR